MVFIPGLFNLTWFLFLFFKSVFIVLSIVFLLFDNSTLGSLTLSAILGGSSPTKRSLIGFDFNSLFFGISSCMKDGLESSFLSSLEL